MKTKPKSGAGRPRRSESGEPSKLVPIRMTDSERASFQVAADRAGLSFSEWARLRLEAAAKRESKRD